MALDLDAGCLLKVLCSEPETLRTLELIAEEDRIVVSSLARVEALTPLHGRVAGGHLSRAGARRLAKRLAALLATDPYEPMNVPVTIYDLAVEHVAPFAPNDYCRSLDRLYLAVMDALRLRRLLTNDDAQARVAERLDFDVVFPRGDRTRYGKRRRSPGEGEGPNDYVATARGRRGSDSVPGRTVGST
ncbi:MAG: PIN domain-containing protein [Deltaproteobacteria bacterium]|nr:PIN domain-containing protein [Deltaproteobacteria bacterium]